MTDKKDAAVATLEHLGYTHEGGNLWKPPLGKAPDFNMLDSLRARAASLEDQLIAQANRAVIAEQQVITLTQRLDMANRLNTDARNLLAQQAARQAAPDGREPIETVKYWRDAYANPQGDKHFMGHGMVVKIMDDHLAMLSATPRPPEREPLTDEQIARAAVNAGMKPIYDKPKKPMVNALGSSIPFTWLKAFARGIGATND